MYIWYKHKHKCMYTLKCRCLFKSLWGKNCFCCVDGCPQLCISSKFPVVTDDSTEPGSSAVGQMATHTALKVNKFYLYIQLLKFLNIQPTWFIQAGYHWPVIIKCRLSNKSFFNKNNLTRRMLCHENVCCSLSVFIIATELDFMWEILRYHTFFSPYI